MEYKAININEKFTKFNEHWSPKIIAQMNNYQFKVVKVQGEFIWHSHKDTDEVFIVMDGTLTIEFRDGSVTLNRGEMFVVPKGVEHKPFAQTECNIMVIEPEGVVNTGDEECELTNDAKYLV